MKKYIDGKLVKKISENWQKKPELYSLLTQHRKINIKCQMRSLISRCPLH
jgi:hypothetical protein